MSALFDKIRKQTVTALSDFEMIEEGDRVLVCCSGGKDSTILFLLLEEIRKRSPFSFTVEGVMLDQKQPGFDAKEFQEWMAQQGLKLTLLEEDTYSVVMDKTEEGKAYCGLCSRLRRGVLYNYADDKGFTKMALGHHRDDLNQTLMLNMFFSGKIAGMPAKLKSNDGRNVVIRPMAYVKESDIEKLVEEYQFPIVPCNLCGSQDGMQRQQMKAMLKEMEEKFPAIGGSLLTAQTNVRPSQLLDERLWDFKSLSVTKEEV